MAIIEKPRYGLPNNIVYSALTDYANTKKLFTCDMLYNNFLISKSIGKGGSGLILDTIVTNDIPEYHLFKNDHVALKYCNLSLYICDPDSGFLKTELNVLIANNVMHNNFICDTINFSLGIFSSCPIMKKYFKELGGYISAHSEDEAMRMEEDNKGGLMFILQHIEGFNLLHVKNEHLTTLLKLNQNIIFEMLYSAICCYLCLGYIQDDLHGDNIMISSKYPSKVLYKIGDKTLLFECVHRPCLIDFGVVGFYDDTNKFANASKIINWCKTLLGVGGIDAYPTFFKDDKILNLSVSQFLYTLPDLYNDNQIFLNDASVLMNNKNIISLSIDNEKINEMKPYKDALFTSLTSMRGGYKHKYLKYKMKYIKLKKMKIHSV